MSITPLGRYLPLSNVTPFTYRDGYTYLEQLEDMSNKVNELIAAYNSVVANVQTLIDDNVEIRKELAATLVEIDGKVDGFRKELAAEIIRFREEILELIGQSMAGVADDPTTGKTAVPVSQVISNVYDHARVLGNFAKRADDLDRTAGEIDALSLTARHHDLSPADTIDDDLTLAPRIITTS